MRYQIGDHLVVLHDNALQVLARFTQHKFHQPEAGGIIIGQYIGNEIHVLRLSTPTELDKATRTTFERSRVAGQIVVNFEFYNSGGQMAYLGEWHTHPEKHPTPSTTDKQMIRQQFEQGQGQRDFLLLLIQGTQSRYVAAFENGKLNQGTLLP